MTTISSATQVYTPQSTSHAHHSGKGRLAEAIQQQEASGALSSTDATALTSALSSIDSSLQSDSSSTSGGTASTSGTGSSSNARLDPSQLKDRIDSLISGQVSNGTLTSDQADELKNLFSSHGTSVTSSSASANGVGGAPPPPPGPPPSDLGAGGSSSDGTSAIGSTSSSTGSTSSSTSSDLLTNFIEQLKAAQSSGSGYAASGLTGSSQSSAFLFDFQS